MAKARPHRPVDVGAPAGVDPLDEAQGRLAGLVVESLQLGPEGLHLAVVGDDVEQVALAQVVQHELQGPADLLDLLAAHAARAVDHEHHRLWRRLLAAALICGLAKRRKKPSRRPVRAGSSAPGADLAPAHVVEQAEIGGRALSFLAVKRHRGVTVVGPLDFTACVGL